MPKDKENAPISDAGAEGTEPPQSAAPERGDAQPKPVVSKEIIDAAHYTDGRGRYLAAKDRTKALKDAFPIALFERQFPSVDLIRIGTEMANELRTTVSILGREGSKSHLAERWDAALSKANLGEGMSEEISWDAAEEIADVPAVNEALANLTEDPTGDNGTCAVIAIVKAARDKGYLSRSVEEEPVSDEQIRAKMMEVYDWCNSNGMPGTRAYFEANVINGLQALYRRKVDAQ